jgi:hypothetical protein
MKENPRLYCDYACTKIGFYLKHVYGVELLKMSVEFVQDEFSKVWLLHAQDVYIRTDNNLPKDYDQIYNEFILSEVKKEEKAKKDKLSKYAQLVTNRLDQKIMEEFLNEKHRVMFQAPQH